MLLTKFHKWYDTIKDRYRFLILIVIALPLILAQLLIFINTQLFLVLLSITLWIMLTRLHYLYWSK